MNIYFARAGSAALVYILASNVAMAELSAQDVWSDWRAYMTGSGYEVSASEQVSDGTLVVSDLSLVMTTGSPAVMVKITADKIEFRENGDGTVSVILPANLPFSLAGMDPKGEEFDVRIDYTQIGQEMVVSGMPDDMTYKYTASSLSVALASLSVGGAEIPSDQARATATLSNVVSNTRMKIGDLRSYEQEMTSDSLAYDFGFAEAGTEKVGSVKGSLSGFGFSGTASMPKEMDVANMQAMMKAGFGFDSEFHYSGGSTETSANDKGSQFSSTSSSQGGSLKVAMNAQSISYAFGQKATAISVATNQLPFPIALNMADAGFNVTMPIAKSDQPQDFSIGFKLIDFTMSDMIWGIFDPAAVLPRDPATIVFDLAGKATVLFDMFDPAVAEEMAKADAPGQLNALSIKDLRVSAVGTSLSGKGDFTFNNDDMQSFGGFPAPVGSVDLTLSGANGLLDKLIQMGIISDQDAMGARMMMGMLAVPGDGEDTLKSNIEINDKGEVLANGQRIK